MADPTASRRALPFVAPADDALMAAAVAWMEIAVRQIAARPGEISYGDCKALENALDEIAAFRERRRGSYRAIRQALWRVDALLVARGRAPAP